MLSHLFSAPKHQPKQKKKLKIMYIFREHTKIRRKKKIYFPLLSHIFSAPKHQAPSKVAKKKKKKKKNDEEALK